MKRILFLLASFIFFTLGVFSQEFNKAIDKDSLLQTILKDFPEAKKAELLKAFNEGDDQSKKFLLFMFSMPRSSKKEMISNIDSNFDKISLLKNSYAKLVPKGYTVYIELNTPNEILMTKESIDLMIRHEVNRQNDIKQDWNLEYNSVKLSEMIKPLNWTNETLKEIKKLLIEANCISIENGEIITIGFARSGMGKYFFKLFSKDLSAEELKKYNDNCTYIFYKKNIVLEYGSGATGSFCFPD